MDFDILHYILNEVFLCYSQGNIVCLNNLLKRKICFEFKFVTVKMFILALLCNLSCLLSRQFVIWSGSYVYEKLSQTAV